MNNAKILSSEYSAFRKGILEYFEKDLREKKRLVILDPMAGTAPLIPLIESEGHRAYFNDILPLHFFINQAKTYRVFQYYKQRGHNWFLEQLLNYMNMLKGKRLLISEKWIEDSVLDGLANAWHAVEECDETAKTFMRAVILLCVRPLASITKSKNPTWPKFGGISSNKNLHDIIEESLSRFDNYYKRHYQLSFEERNGECIFLNNNASEITLPEKVDLIITSPPYCNRFNIISSYGPENYFLSFLGYAVPTRDIIGTITVKDYYTVESDYDYLTKNSKTAKKMLSVIRKSKKKDDQTYYLKYYARYFRKLFNNMEKVLNNLSPKGKMYFVTQDNWHRGTLIEIDKVLRELLSKNGWESRLLKKWGRHHLGLQNVSKERKFIPQRQFEKLVVMWR